MQANKLFPLTFAKNETRGPALIHVAEIHKRYEHTGCVALHTGLLSPVHYAASWLYDLLTSRATSRHVHVFCMTSGRMMMMMIFWNGVTLGVTPCGL
jgi:hypothetical protein